MSPLRPLAGALLLAAGTAHAADYTVTNGNDAGPGSLRQALLDAAGSPGADTITFAAGVTAVTLDGPLTIGSDLIIDGPGVTLDGRLKGRVLHVTSGAIVTLRGLTITRGLLAGKGIDWNGTAESGSSFGAGIRNDGVLVLDGVAVQGNFATGGGGGGGSAHGGGGGGSGVRVNLEGSDLKGAGGAGGAGPAHGGGSGSIETPGGGTLGGSNGSNGGGAGGGDGSGEGGEGGEGGGGGGGGGWAGGGGAGGRWGAGGGGYGGGGGDSGGGYRGGGGSDGSSGGTAGWVSSGAGGSGTAGNDAPGFGGGAGGGGGYAVLDGVWVGGGGGAAGNSGSNGGAAAGGIYNAAGATLTVQGAGCAVTANLAAGGGGAGYRGGGRAVGGLWNDGALFITPPCQVAISGNVAGAGRNGQGTGFAPADGDLRSASLDYKGLNVDVVGAGSVSAGAASPAPAGGGIAACTSAGGVACRAAYMAESPAPVVTLAASAPAGQHFVGWSGACTADADDPLQATVAMDAHKSCTATFATNTFFDGTTQPASGAGTTASASFTGGGDACGFDAAHTGFVPAPAALPPGGSLPQGQFQFRLVGCDTSPVTMTITWPQPVVDYIKYGRQAPSDTEFSYFTPAGLQINGNQVSFTVIDGQLGDDDWTQNGVIEDPSGPLLPASVQAIPTLGEWGRLLLALSAAVLGVGALRRHRRG